LRRSFQVFKRTVFSIMGAAALAISLAGSAAMPVFASTNAFDDAVLVDSPDRYWPMHSYGIANNYSLPEISGFGCDSSSLMNGPSSHYTLSDSIIRADADGSLDYSTVSGPYLVANGSCHTLAFTPGGGQHTWEMWVTAPTSGSIHTVFATFHDGVPGAQNRWLYLQLDATNHVQIGGRDGVDGSNTYTDQQATGTALTAGTRHQIDVTFDGPNGLMKAYLDGNSTPDATITHTWIGTRLRNCDNGGTNWCDEIGAWWIAGGGMFQRFNAKIEGFGEWNSLLTTTQMANHYNAAAAVTAVGLGTAGGSTDSNNANRLTATEIFTGAGGLPNATRICANVGAVDSSPSNLGNLALYADSSGAPGALMVSTGSFALTANSWNCHAIATVTDLAANTAYWLAYNTNGSGASSNNLTYDAGTGTSATRSFSWAVFPNPFGTPTTGTSKYAMYIDNT